jgi:cell wall-associated NlpC family hydrolase
MVTSDKAVIVAGREAAGRVLSVCPKGQYLALSGQTPTQYAVLMIDHSLGYVSRSDVQLLQYQVVNNTPDAASGSSDQAPVGAASSLGLKLVQTAQGYLGVPYVWGGNTAAGIDCSGFVKAVYGTYGLSLPRHSGDQASVGYDVPRGDWAQWVPGDRMYFACHHPEIDHTGMYIGGGYFIHASAGHGHQVAIDRVDGKYYADHLVCVRRSRELVGDTAAPGPIAPPSPAMSSASVDDPEAGQD